MTNIFIFLIIPLLQGIRSDDNDVAQREHTLDADFENHFMDYPIEAVASANHVRKSKNEMEKSVVKQSNVDYIKYHTDKNEVHNKAYFKQFPRKERQSDSDPYKGVDCYTCYGFGTSNAAIKCYAGGVMKTQKCSDFEQCYTELHPRYIKRGCILPSTLNRTFVCKCPLCNNKSSKDLSYYNYVKYSDWQYDNRRLEKPVQGMNLICKYCETKGTNDALDEKCKFGKEVDHVSCGTNQICYINIDNEIDYVSRGCVDVPAYNSMFYFCNKSFCNIDRIPNPHTKKPKYRFQKLTAASMVTDYAQKTISLNIMYIYLGLFYIL